MKKIWMLAPALLCLVLGACRSQPSGPTDDRSGSARSAPTITIAGDAKAGREAFIDLKCTTCHSVLTESPEFPSPVSEEKGPAFDRETSKLSPAYLLTAVIDPSHDFSQRTSEATRMRLTGTLSPMGDYSRVMTVRQLVDIHAYLSTLK